MRDMSDIKTLQHKRIFWVKYEPCDVNDFMDRCENWSVQNVSINQLELEL